MRRFVNEITTQRGRTVYYYERKHRLARLGLFPLGSRAVGVLTLTGNPSDGETVTIEDCDYTFQTVLTDSPRNTLIGATALDSVANLVASAQCGEGRGVVYAASTQPHPFILATLVASSANFLTEDGQDIITEDGQNLEGEGSSVVMNVRAKVRGVGGNSIATTDTLANGSWGAAHLTGGA